MPEYGRLGQDILPHTSPAVAPLYPRAPWSLPGARVLKIVYETDAAPVLEWLPPRLSRSAPPYAIVTVAQYPESPVGPFSLAAQYIGCRAGMFVRAFTHQAVTDSTAALIALREVWGFPCMPGDVDLDAGTNRVLATVALNGVPLVEASLMDTGPIDGDSVRFDPMLNVRTAPSLEEGKQHDLLQILQIDPEVVVKESLRGTGSIRFPSSALSAPWHLLPVRNVISCVFCTVDTELPKARFVLPY